MHIVMKHVKLFLSITQQMYCSGESVLATPPWPTYGSPKAASGANAGYVRQKNILVLDAAPEFGAVAQVRRLEAARHQSCLHNILHGARAGLQVDVSSTCHVCW